MLPDLMFPPEEFTPRDQDVLKATFSNPLVVRYLQSLAKEDTKIFLSLRLTDVPDEAVATRRRMLEAKLEVYSSLLSLSTTEEGI